MHSVSKVPCPNITAVSMSKQRYIPCTGCTCQSKFFSLLYIQQQSVENSEDHQLFYMKKLTKGRSKLPHSINYPSFISLHEKMYISTVFVDPVLLECNTVQVKLRYLERVRLYCKHNELTVDGFVNARRSTSPNTLYGSFPLHQQPSANIKRFILYTERD